MVVADGEIGERVLSENEFDFKILICSSLGKSQNFHFLTFSSYIFDLKSFWVYNYVSIIKFY